MSRIGKLPITIPIGTKVSQCDSQVIVEGPKGTASVQLLPNITVTITDDTIIVSRKSDQPVNRAAHGLIRQLIANSVTGTSSGFEKRLEMKGVGYRAATEGDKKLILSVGFSHPVPVEAPESVSFKLEKNVIVITGNDKQVVGEIAAKIRRVRPPEPYKGKGIMYLGERVRRKAGKAAKASA